MFCKVIVLLEYIDLFMTCKFLKGFSAMATTRSLPIMLVLCLMPCYAKNFQPNRPGSKYNDVYGLAIYILACILYF